MRLFKYSPLLTSEEAEENTRPFQSSYASGRGSHVTLRYTLSRILLAIVILPLAAIILWFFFIIRLQNYSSPTIPSLASAPRPILDLYSRQSRTLATAQAHYRLHNGGRAPPPRYEQWFAFAQRRQCLIDDYMQISKDLEPWYQLKAQNPGAFREALDRTKGKPDVKIVGVWRGRVWFRTWFMGSVFDLTWLRAWRRVSSKKQLISKNYY